MLIFDATPLIYLAKVGKLHLLRNISKEKVIPWSVFEEVVVKGKEAGKADALIIERLIKQGVFQVTEVEETDVYRELTKNKKLSKADVVVLALAKVEDGVAVVDEDYARWVAEVEDIKCGGAIYLIFSLLKGDIITKERQEKL
jgi:predicted nucleic acid-binding protein